MKLRPNLIIYFLIIINISLCNSSNIIYRTPGDNSYNIISVSPSDMDIRYTTPSDSGIYVTQTEFDSTSKLSLDSHSTGSYYVGAQGPSITIDKSTKDFREVYNKNSNITIKIKIINNNKQNRLENVYIYEDIPDGFEYIGATPAITTKPNKPNTIIWDCEDQIRSSKTFEYTIRTNKSGKHNFGSTMLEATVVDKNGRKNEIIVNYNNYLNILIHNNPPKFLNLDPEPPINLKLGMITNKPINIKYINASLTDLDNDTINCELLSGSGCKPIKPLYYSPNKIASVVYYNYTWDVSGFDRGTHILTLDAFDGDDHTLSQNVNLNIYKISSEIKAGIFTILIIIIAGLVVRHSSKYSTIKRKLEKNWVIYYITCYIKHKLRRNSIINKLKNIIKCNRVFCRLKDDIDTKKSTTKKYMNSQDISQDGNSANKKNETKSELDIDPSLPPEQRRKNTNGGENDLYDHERPSGYDSLSNNDNN